MVFYTSLMTKDLLSDVIGLCQEFTIVVMDAKLCQ